MVGVGRWVTRPPLWWLRVCIAFVMQVVELVGDVANIVVVGVKLVILILVVSIENK